MVKDLFFNRLVTKDMQPVHGDERFFEGYLTVQIKDKQGEITVVDELYKVLPIWMDRGAPISDTHSNRIIGKGINYSKDIYKDKDGEEYPAIKITGKIHKDYELDNEIWKKIKSGEYKGLSFGGATKSDRDPVRMKDGSIAYSLKDLEHYEVAVCADPAVPLALITDYNPVAKSATNAEVREDGKMIIKCDKFGCYVTKPIPDGKGGKGDFDHCEEKNQDKNDPAAFCGAIQHKLEKAIEAGMIQQVAKDGLEIFLTKEELNKVCSGCGKTLEEHGVVKYDHSNSMGDQHSMYNQNTGRETWVGQGLPQPTVEGKDDNPAERGLTINGDAMQNSDKPTKKKGRTARNRKRRQAKQVKEGMSMFDEPKELDPEVEGILEEAKRYGTGNPRASEMYKSLESIFKREDWDKEEAEWEQIGDTNKFKKKPKKRLQDVNIDTSNMFGRDKLKDALTGESGGDFKRWGDKPQQQSGRDPKTGKERMDYLVDQQPYGFGKLGKKEPQTSRGQADDATQSRLDRYSGRKYSPRESGSMDSQQLGRMSQHEPALLSPSASDTGWAEGKKRPIPRELYNEGERKVPKGGKRPVEGKPSLGKPAGRTGNEKLLDVMTGADDEASETYDAEDERRRGERFGQTKRGKLQTGSKAPKTKPSKKPSKDKKPDRTFPKKSLESIFKRDDWDEEEKENTDAYLGRSKKKPWTSRDQSEYDAFEELSKLPKERLDKLHDSVQEAIDGIEQEGKIREGMVGTFGKSLESIISKKLRPEEIQDMDGLENEDETDKRLKENYDVPLPRFVKEPTPCKDCGGEHDEVSLLAEDIATQRKQGHKNHDYDLVDMKDHVLPNLLQSVIDDKSDELTNKSLESIVKGDAESNPDMSPEEWLQWYKKRPKKKAEESNFGAGQRGLGYGNEGHTVVQGSGQNHTISEIPPEMEIIVHDVNDIKESKKEGYTTEAGNNKRGDPSRATNDDDSLLSQTYAKKE